MADEKTLKQRLDDVQKLATIAREQFTKGLAALDEIDRLMGGGARMAEMLREAERTFDRLWCARYAGGQAGHYLWAHMRDRPQLTRLIKALGVGEVQARMRRYIADDDAFYAKSRHPFGLFVSSVNRYAQEQLSPASGFDLSGDVVGCTHRPPCASDAEHTRRRRTELHG